MTWRSEQPVVPVLPDLLGFCSQCDFDEGERVCTSCLCAYCGKHELTPETSSSKGLDTLFESRGLLRCATCAEMAFPMNRFHFVCAQKYAHQRAQQQSQSSSVAAVVAIDCIKCHTVLFQFTFPVAVNSVKQPTTATPRLSQQAKMESALVEATPTAALSTLNAGGSTGKLDWLSILLQSDPRHIPVDVLQYGALKLALDDADGGFEQQKLGRFAPACCSGVITTVNPETGLTQLTHPMWESQIDADIQQHQHKLPFTSSSGTSTRSSTKRNNEKEDNGRTMIDPLDVRGLIEYRFRSKTETPMPLLDLLCRQEDRSTRIIVDALDRRVKLTPGIVAARKRVRAAELWRHSAKGLKRVEASEERGPEDDASDDGEMSNSDSSDDQREKKNAQKRKVGQQDTVISPSSSSTPSSTTRRGPQAKRSTGRMLAALSPTVAQRRFQ